MNLIGKVEKRGGYRNWSGRNKGRWQRWVMVGFQPTLRADWEGGETGRIQKLEWEE
jgi:hypothetical protein